MSQVTRSLTVLLVIRVVLLNISSVTLSAINYTVEKRSFKTRNPPLYCSSFVLFFFVVVLTRSHSTQIASHGLNVVGLFFFLFHILRPVGEQCHRCPAVTAPTWTAWVRSPRKNLFKNLMWVTLSTLCCIKSAMQHNKDCMTSLVLLSWYFLTLNEITLTWVLHFSRASAKTVKLVDQIYGPVWR